MKCIANYDTRLLTLAHHRKIEPCLPSCEETIVDLVGCVCFNLETFTFHYNNNFNCRFYKKRKARPYVSKNDSDPISGHTSVKIEVENNPKKLTTEVSFSSLDFVVIIGSIIGLFFGASYLSLAELMYIWIWRKI